MEEFGGKWFKIWFDDKQSMIETMTRNIAADLQAGYNYFGNSIRRQREQLERYQKQFEEEIEKFKEMDDQQISRWCYFDMKKRGAIE